jgi:hypothetical protein
MKRTFLLLVGALTTALCQLQGCLETTSASEAQSVFLNLSMGVGCNYKFADRSCLNRLKRADLLVSRITVYGE